MHTQTDSKGCTILIVDDNTANLGVIADYLESFDFGILTAMDGKDALETAQAARPDLVLLDVMMPGIDGFETCRRLKANEQTQAIPVIFMTALAGTEDKVKGFEAGGVDYVTKPVNQAEVLMRVRTHLQISALTRSLQAANAEISALNERLKQENLRLEAEIEVTHRLQQMLLPNQAELAQVEDLDIAGFMQPADEVGGDYYDVLRHNGQVKIGIGDVTGHGLESGMVMLMVQTAVRTLLTSELRDPVRFMDVLNRVLRANLQRMGVNKSLSLALLDYEREKQHVRVSGQHEQIIVLRQDGSVHLQDTQDLGFPIGVVEEIGELVSETTIPLAPGEGIVLYSDGITEAENPAGQLYGLERLCQVVREHWAEPSEAIKAAAAADARAFIGPQRVYDDLALVVIKRK